MHWSSPREIKLYVENVRGRTPAYLVSEAAVQEALRGISVPWSVTVRFNDDPDLSALRDAHVFVGSGFDQRRLLEHGSALKLVHCTSAGVERYLPLDWLQPGAALTNSSGIHAEKAGEFGLLSLLMLNDRIPLHATNQRAHRWQAKLSTPINGKTVLIFGVGALGAAVAEKAKLLGLKVLGVRRSGAPHSAVDEMRRPSALHELLPRADFFVASCPLTSETRQAIGATELALLKPEAGVVNISRAAVVDYDALAKALRENRLSGAVLDVFAQEPLPADAPWWDVPNLFVIPHVSSDTPVGYIERSLTILGKNVELLVEGKPLINVVDRELGY